MKTYREILEASKRAVEFIISQMKNDESSTDAEMVLHLSKETHIPIGKISKLVKAERGGFLKDSMMDEDKSKAIVKKYI